MKGKRLSGLLVVVALISAELACGPTPTPPTPPTEPPVDNPQQPDPPQPAGLPDLTITSVTLNLSSQPGMTHEVVGVIANNGPADASGFSAGCTYQCIGGTISGGGLDIVIGGAVAANDTFTYRSQTRIACDPMPASLNLDCTIDDSNAIPESNESNNLSYFTVSVP